MRIGPAARSSGDDRAGGARRCGSRARPRRWAAAARSPAGRWSAARPGWCRRGRCRPAGSRWPRRPTWRAATRRTSSSACCRPSLAGVRRRRAGRSAGGAAGLRAAAPHVGRRRSMRPVRATCGCRSAGRARWPRWPSPSTSWRMHCSTASPGSGRSSPRCRTSCAPRSPGISGQAQALADGLVAAGGTGAGRADDHRRGRPAAAVGHRPARSRPARRRRLPAGARADRSGRAAARDVGRLAGPLRGPRRPLDRRRARLAPVVVVTDAAPAPAGARRAGGERPAAAGAGAAADRRGVRRTTAPAAPRSQVRDGGPGLLDEDFPVAFEPECSASGTAGGDRPAPVSDCPRARPRHPARRHDPGRAAHRRAGSR